MPQYRVTERSFFQNRMVEAGAIVEYDGLPGKALEPLDKAGEAKKKEWEKSRRPADPNEAIGRGMAKGMAAAQKKGAGDDDEDENRDAVPGVVSTPGALTTIGHSSMSQRSAGGNDADHLYETDAEGKLVPQNPRDTVPAHVKADSPDKGEAKDTEAAPAKSVAKSATKGK